MRETDGEREIRAVGERGSDRWAVNWEYGHSSSFSLTENCTTRDGNITVAELRSVSSSTEEMVGPGM